MIGLTPDIFGGAYDTLLDDRTIAASQRSRVARLDLLADFEAIDRSALSRHSVRQLDTALSLYRAAAAMDRHGYGYANLGWASPYVINPFDGAYVDLVKFLTAHHTIRSRKDADAWLARFGQMDEAVRDERRRFETDLASGAVPPRAVLQRTLEKVRALTPASPREYRLVRVFTEALAQIPEIPEDELLRLVDQAATLAGGDLTKEYTALAETLEAALEKASDEPGVWRLENGDAYYADALRLYTTTELTAAQLHEAGEKLTASISEQMDAILLELGQEDGTVAQRMQALAADPVHLFPETLEGRAALIAAVENQIKWIEPQLPRVIQTQPQSKLEIRQLPPTSQDTASGAYYKPAALDGSRPSTYTLNIQSTLDWPVWMLPTLSFHEAAPGHHIQAGAVREQPDQPVFNHFVSSPVFAEGWAVYAEDLADELGAYQEDKLAKLGYLQSLLFRAARLVVDTGIHAQRWSREQAIDYLVETTGLPRQRMENEVDRYIVWPGQACSYMVGRETIRRLRETARQELGPAFDLRLFHDAVLTPGPRPLPILEADIYDWIASRRPQPPAE